MSDLKTELTISEIRKNLAQEHHWEQQQFHWKIIVVVGILAVIANVAVRIWGA